MDPIVALLVLIVPFILYFVFKKLFIKYFTWVYNKTNVNPITVPRQLIGFAFFAPVLLGCFNEDLFFEPIVSIGIPVVAFVMLVLVNLRMRSLPIIILSTVCQVLFGALFVARLFVWVALVIWSWVSAIMWGNGERITYNPFYVTKLQKNGTVTENSYNPDAVAPHISNGGIMNNMKDFTDPIEHSRNMTVKHQLEVELEDVQTKIRESNAFGVPDPDLIQREQQLQDELAAFNKKT